MPSAPFFDDGMPVTFVRAARPQPGPARWSGPRAGTGLRATGSRGSRARPRPPTVTLAGYERTGGIDGAVAASAQRAYEHLTPGQQAAARQIFLRLTATSSDGVDIVDRATRAELTEGTSAAGCGDVEAVLEAFAAERLLTLAAGTVEISHEALLTAWPLLRDTWLADSHADRIVRTRLHNTAADWDRSSRDPSYLYTGTILQAATETAARIDADPVRNPPLSQVDRRFLHASTRAHDESSVGQDRATIRDRSPLNAPDPLTAESHTVTWWASCGAALHGGVGVTVASPTLGRLGGLAISSAPADCTYRPAGNNRTLLD